MATDPTTDIGRRLAAQARALRDRLDARAVEDAHAVGEAACALSDPAERSAAIADLQARCDDPATRSDVRSTLMLYMSTMLLFPLPVAGLRLGGPALDGSDSID